MTTMISCTDTAKMIRKALSEAFPKIKFSVKSKTYSGGASIRVNWIDGPNEAQVEAVAGRFEGSYFDGMSDYKGNNYHMLDGKQVSFCADHIFCNRDYSDAAIEKAIARVFRQYAGNFAGSGIEVPTAEDYKNGNLYRVQIPHMNAHHMHDLQCFVRQALTKNSDRLSVTNSPTAAKVFQTHTDRHGQSNFDSVTAGL